MTAILDTDDKATHEARRDELAGRLFGAVLASLDLQAVYLGDRLGLYRALEEGGPATPPELAERAGIDPRYAREWLEHQAVGAILDVDDPSAAADERRYTLPGGPRGGPDRPGEPRAGRAARPVRGRDGEDDAEAARCLPDRRRCRLGGLRSGCRRGPGRHQPAAVPPPRRRLDRRPAGHRGAAARAARVASPTSPAARAGRRSPSPATSRASRSTASTSTRARSPGPRRTPPRPVSTIACRSCFADAANAAGAGRYDLVTIFEALHDMARPAEVLATAKRLLAPGGAVLIADERVAETFTVPGDEAERMFYGYSVVACLANGLVDQPVVGTGTVHPAGGPRGDRPRGRFQRLHGPADRARLVPLLPPRSGVTAATARGCDGVATRPGAILRARSGGSRECPPADPRVLASTPRGQSRAPARR